MKTKNTQLRTRNVYDMIDGNNCLDLKEAYGPMAKTLSRKDKLVIAQTMLGRPYKAVEVVGRSTRVKVAPTFYNNRDSSGRFY